MPLPFIQTYPPMLLKQCGFEATGLNLRVSHDLSLAILNEEPRVAYARMDSIMDKRVDINKMRDVIAQLSGKGVQGIVYDFDNYSPGEAIGFALHSLIPAGSGFDIDRCCFSSNFGRNFYVDYLVPYFGSASREADFNWFNGSLKDALDKTVVRVRKNSL